jgi:DMSO reductase family type II enzyme heme b subunit
MLKKSPLLAAFLFVVIVYLALQFLVTPPLPQSLMIQYLIFVIIGVLLVVSFDDDTFEKFLSPIHTVLGDPQKKISRIFFLTLIPLIFTWFTYSLVKPTSVAPVGLRTVHPAPPSSLKVFNKQYDLNSLENPLRKDRENFKKNVAAGAEIYYKNCFFCHGDKLAGDGQYAPVFNPKPINFQDVGTIAQLQEAYLFWRITTGGTGLPQEGAPWDSVMPVWHEMMGEQEVWQVILFLYDYTGQAPRSWEKKNPETDLTTPNIEELTGETIYKKRCIWCHGVEGDGNGIAADLMYPRPRDFTLGQYKFKTSSSDDSVAYDKDIRRTIREGLPGTAMPGWKDLIDDQGIDKLVKYIKAFGEIDEVPEHGVDYGTEIASTPESIEAGRKLFVKACVQCHGEEGRGNITSGRKLRDDYGYRIWPRDLTKPDTWRFTFSRKEIFERISIGIPGTPMPNHTDTMSTTARWQIVNYVVTLRKNTVAIDPQKTVVKAFKLPGDLPTKIDDPNWSKAEPFSFALAPNLIRDQRLYYSLNDQVTIRSTYNEKEIAFLLEWNDRTYSVPGSELALEYQLKDIKIMPDAIAVQLPETPTDGVSKPSIRHGDISGRTQIWYWNAGSQEEAKEQHPFLLVGKSRKKAPHPAKIQDLQSSGSWKNGRWRVILKRPRKGLQGEGSSIFTEGKYIPFSLAAWDGTLGETGGKHTLSSWNWLLLPPQPDLFKIYGLPTTVFIFFLLFGWGLSRNIGRKYRAK